MRLKDEVLVCLEQNREGSVSGEQLAERFQVSRSAVWKAISSLREEGYVIEAVTNRGYRLVKGEDRMTAAGVASFVK